MAPVAGLRRSTVLSIRPAVVFGSVSSGAPRNKATWNNFWRSMLPSTAIAWAARRAGELTNYGGSKTRDHTCVIWWLTAPASIPIGKLSTLKYDNRTGGKTTANLSLLPITGRRHDNGDFVISAEIAPPMEPTGERIAHVARCLRDYVDTANFTDNPLGVSRMSGLACTLYSLENDLEPVLQLQTRHRSRYALESEVTGAAVVGVRNILCLTDDIGRLGLGPAPRPEINDLDAVQALWVLRRLRDEGINVAGERVDHRPDYFLGAIASPYAALPHYEAIITEKKIKAGAQFLQTMPIFNLDGFSEWLAALDQRNLLGKVYLIATVALIKNTWHARFLANEVPGIQIPVEVMTRLEDAADVQEESIQIALNFIANLKEMPEIHGLHILAPYQEELVPRLVQEAGLMSVSSGR